MSSFSLIETIKRIICLQTRYVRANVNKFAETSEAHT